LASSPSADGGQVESNIFHASAEVDARLKRSAGHRGVLCVLGGLSDSLASGDTDGAHSGGTIPVRAAQHHANRAAPKSLAPDTNSGSAEIRGADRSGSPSRKADST
jgi:hypothetical protein